MITRIGIPRGIRHGVLGAALLAAGAFVHVGAAAEAPPLQVTVHQAAYSIGSRSFDDLADLAAAVRAAGATRVELDACGPAASYALLAAAQGLAGLPLDLQMLSPTAALCTAGMYTRATAAMLPTGIETTRVEKYWRQVTP